jgi:hypothetical protein
VEKRALLLADVHERGLDAGQYRLDPAQVDITDGAAVVGPIDQELDQPIVFQDGHAGFPLAPVDQDLALQDRPQPPRQAGLEYPLENRAVSGRARQPNTREPAKRRGRTRANYM